MIIVIVIYRKKILDNIINIIMFYYFKRLKTTLFNKRLALFLSLKHLNI